MPVERVLEGGDVPRPRRPRLLRRWWIVAGLLLAVGVAGVNVAMQAVADTAADGAVEVARALFGRSGDVTVDTMPLASGSKVIWRGQLVGNLKTVVKVRVRDSSDSLVVYYGSWVNEARAADVPSSGIVA